MIYVFGSFPIVWTLNAAASLIAVVPVVALFAAIERELVAPPPT